MQKTGGDHNAFVTLDKWMDGWMIMGGAAKVKMIFAGIIRIQDIHREDVFTQFHEDVTPPPPPPPPVGSH